MQFDIITVFPQYFEGPFRFGVLNRAVQTGRVRIGIHNLRDFTSDRHRTVDDRPFGGGEGMVLKPEPIYRAVASLEVLDKERRDTGRERVVLMSAQGKLFTQSAARDLSHLDRIVLVCGRYEGVDERVSDVVADMELSVGDFVLSGGELAAAVVVDTVSRLLPGVLGNEDSSRYESFAAPAKAESDESLAPRSTCDSGGLLDYPHYTRPADFQGIQVPAVLSTGNHEEIRRWRRMQSLRKTLENRPDLLARIALSKDDRDLLDRLKSPANPESKPSLKR